VVETCAVRSAPFRSMIHLLTSAEADSRVIQNCCRDRNVTSPRVTSPLAMTSACVVLVANHMAEVFQWRTAS